MCAHLLKAHAAEQHPGRFARAFESGFEAMVRFYDSGLKWVLAHQLITLMVTIATVGLTVFLAIVVPKGFFPEQDTGVIVGVLAGAARGVVSTA